MRAIYHREVPGAASMDIATYNVQGTKLYDSGLRFETKDIQL